MFEWRKIVSLKRISDLCFTFMYQILIIYLLVSLNLPLLAEKNHLYVTLYINCNTFAMYDH